eukprot:105149_1
MNANTKTKTKHSCQQCLEPEINDNNKLIAIDHQTGIFWIHRICWRNYHNETKKSCTFCISGICIFNTKQQTQKVSNYSHDENKNNSYASDCNDLTQLKLKAKHIEGLIVLWKSSADILSRISKPDPYKTEIFATATIERIQDLKDTISSREKDIFDELQDIKESNKEFYNNFLIKHEFAANIQIASNKINIKKK